MRWAQTRTANWESMIRISHKNSHQYLLRRFLTSKRWMSSAVRCTRLCYAALAVHTPGAATTMDSAAVVILARAIWLSYLVPDSSISKATIAQIFFKLIAAPNIPHLLMMLDGSLRADEDRTDSLALDRLPMSQHQFTFPRYQIRSMKSHAASSTLLP